MGWWFNRDQLLGVEGNGFVLEHKPTVFNAASSATGTPLFARPVVNALNGLETVQLVSGPNIAAGAITVGSSTTLFGHDLNLVHRLPPSGGFNVDVLGGFRYLNLAEDLDLSQNTTLLPGGTAGFAGMLLPMSGTFAVLDQFRARNQFYGGQIGMRASYTGERWFAEIDAKVALGKP